jgi:hypothetical protein
MSDSREAAQPAPTQHDVLCVCGEREGNHIGKPRGIPNKCYEYRPVPTRTVLSDTNEKLEELRKRDPIAEFHRGYKAGAESVYPALDQRDKIIAELRTTEQPAPEELEAQLRSIIGRPRIGNSQVSDIAAFIRQREAAATMKEHANHVQFASDMYSILVDPCAEGSMKEADIFAACLKAATEQREALYEAHKTIAGERTPLHEALEKLAAEWERIANLKLKTLTLEDRDETMALIGIETGAQATRQKCADELRAALAPPAQEEKK